MFGVVLIWYEGIGVKTGTICRINYVSMNGLLMANASVARDIVYGSKNTNGATQQSEFL